ncbi:MAG: sporulation membrane protein YtaF [Romboutsia sp.]
MNLASALLLSISANLDTFAVAVSYGLKKMKLSFSSILFIAFITSIGTFLSMYLGLLATSFISIRLANSIGSLMLIAMGVWFVFDYFKNNNSNSLQDQSIKNFPTYHDILSDPLKADKDNSGNIDFKECITLSIALSLNNIGLGIAASIAGINIYLNTCFTFIVTLLGFYLGGIIGRSYLSKIFGKYSSLISALIIIILGFYELFV